MERMKARTEFDDVRYDVLHHQFCTRQIVHKSD